MADISELVERLRRKINDNNGERFSDPDLQQELQDALHRHNEDYVMAADEENPEAIVLPEAEEYLVVKLAAVSCYRVMAARAAHQYPISVDTVNVDKSKITRNWLSIAESLEKEYLADKAGLDETVQVANVSRYSVQVNRMVGQ